MSHPIPVAKRFWNKVQINDWRDCWTWTAHKTPMGYGQIGVAGHRVACAHRVSYELLVGTIPEGLHLDHLCRNPSCVNPMHLEPVTPGENVRRGNAGKRYAERTHCPHGHPYDEDNTYVWRGGRHCRTCNNNRTRAYKARKRAEAGT